MVKHYKFRKTYPLGEPVDNKDRLLNKLEKICSVKLAGKNSQKKFLYKSYKTKEITSIDYFSGFDMFFYRYFNGIDIATKNEIPKEIESELKRLEYKRI
jgi:hypothetical protein